MSRYFLARLQIEGFRGINNFGSPLDLQFKSDSVNSIWAPNGLGKSSVFEALSFAIRGFVPKLRKLEASEHPDDYYCNLFHGGNATIVLTFTADDRTPSVVIEVVRTSGGNRTVSSPSGHADPEGFLRSLDEDHTLLDYATFESFMEDSALERGRSFSSLLGMAHLSHVRCALERLSHGGNLTRDFDIRPLETQLGQLSSERETAITSIRGSFEKLTGGPVSEPIDVEDVISAGTVALSGVKLLAPVIEDHTLMEVSFEALSKKVKDEEGGEKRERLADVFRDLTTLDSLKAKNDEGPERERLSTLIAERDLALEGTRGDLFRRMYLAVQTVLDSDDWETPEKCPACESTPEQAPEEYINARLDVFKLAELKNTEFSDAWSETVCALRLRDLESCTVLEVPEEQRKFASWDATARGNAASAAIVDEFVKRLDELETDRQEKIETLTAEKLELEAALPKSLVTLTEQLVAAEELRDSLLAYQTSIDEAGPMATVERKLAQRRRWINFIDQASSEFASAESTFSRDRTAALETRYRDIYKAITTTDEIVPALDKAAGSQRLELRLGQFFGRGGHSARALLSESYRNAFGIAVFLSAALEKTSTPRFIVLDDITSSFDAGRQWFLMELLRTQVGLPENSDGVQVIILSHDGLLEKLFDQLGNQENWSHRRLQGQAPTGAVICDTQDNNRLRATAEQLLNDGQVHQAEPLIRQYLEFKLLQIIKKVRIPVPIDFVIRDDRKMVRNCLDCIKAQVDLHQSAGDLIVEPQQVTSLKSTHIPALVANWVSHYETGAGASIAPTVYLAILQTIDDLANCFCYQDISSGNRRFYRSLNQRS